MFRTNKGLMNNHHKKTKKQNLVQRQVDHTVELQEIKYILFNNVLPYFLTMYRLKSHIMLSIHVYFIHSNNICFTFLLFRHLADAFIQSDLQIRKSN